MFIIRFQIDGKPVELKTEKRSLSKALYELQIENPDISPVTVTTPAKERIVKFRGLEAPDSE